MNKLLNSKAVGVLLLSASPAAAELIAFEPFDYPLDSKAPMNGGSGWAEAWKKADGVTDATLELRAGNLGSIGKSPEGAHVKGDAKGTFRKLSEEAAAKIAEQSSGNGEIWISFNAQQPTGKYGSVTLWNAGCDDVTDDTEFYSLVIGRNPFDGGNWSWSDITSVGVASTGGIPAKTVVRYLLHIDYQENKSAVTMRIITEASQAAATLADSKPAASASAGVSNESGNRPVFDRIRISGSIDMVFDSIRIGTTFEDVMPHVAVDSSEKP